MYRLISLWGLCIGVAACGHTVTTASVERKTGRVVEPGIQASAPVGSVMFGEHDYLAADGAVILGATPTDAASPFGAINVPTGSDLLAVVIDGEPAYCTLGWTYSNWPSSPKSSTCYFDRDGDSEFEQLWFKPGAVMLSHDLASPIPYRAQEITEANGFKYELLYSGIDRNNTLRVSYREYIDNFARPAYSQELTYPMGDHGLPLIQFREVEIQVIEANASGITYQVVSGLDEVAAWVEPK